ncbi:MAG TPA: hypothetical protein VM934_09620 [Pyrinomonadaceae bacterium]|jgi:hypothetical protein|nr:hypothetical protein [Pyrinomonadaceae bacterium]
MNDKTKAALIGGLVIGVMALVPFINSCCCLWAIGGGVLAVALYHRKSPTPLRPGDGALLGAIAGGVGALIHLVVSIPVALFFQMDDIARAMEQLKGQGIQVPFNGIALVIVSLLMTTVGLVGFATLGGLLGVPLFEKRATNAPPPPPPPPDFSQPPGGPAAPSSAGTYGGPTGGAGGFGSGT